VEPFDDSGTPKLRSTSNNNVIYEKLVTAFLMAFKVEKGMNKSVVKHVFKIDDRFDLRHDLQVRILWTHANVAAVGNRSITWRLDYNFFEEDEAIGGTLTELDFTVDYPVVAVYPILGSPWETITAPGEEKTSLELETYVKTYHADLTEDVYMVGLELEYTENISRLKALRRRKR
jgi:hypothetical protein